MCGAVKPTVTRRHSAGIPREASVWAMFVRIKPGLHFGRVWPRHLSRLTMDATCSKAGVSRDRATTCSAACRPTAAFQLAEKSTRNLLFVRAQLCLPGGRRMLHPDVAAISLLMKTSQHVLVFVACLRMERIGYRTFVYST